MKAFILGLLTGLAFFAILLGIARSQKASNEVGFTPPALEAHKIYTDQIRESEEKWEKKQIEEAKELENSIRETILQIAKDGYNQHTIIQIGRVGEALEDLVPKLRSAGYTVVINEADSYLAGKRVSRETKGSIRYVKITISW